MSGMKLSVCAAVVCLIGTAANAQLLFSFEGGFEDWGISGFGNSTEFVALSGVGATDGAGSLAMGHDNGGFSWDGSWVSGDAGNAVYQAISAAAANPAGKVLEFDWTWRANDLPTFQTFANLSFSLQSDAGFKQVDSLASIGTAQDITIPIALELDGPSSQGSGDISGFTANSSFYRITVAPNVDGGRGITTGYIDNIRITPEPTSLGLLALGGLAMLRRR